VTPSLHLRLLYPLLWLWIGSAVTASLAGFWFVQQATEQAFDRILADDARALAAQVRWNSDGPTFALDAGTAASLVYDSLAPSHFSVQTLAGRVLVGEARLLPPEQSANIAADQPVFQNLLSGKSAQRVVGIKVGPDRKADAVWVLVAEDQSKRLHLRDELAQAIFLPAVLIGFVFLPLLFMGVKYGLQMASRTSDSVAARSVNDLSPLPLDEVPQELRSLVIRINDLLARLKATLAHERQFIAEAAHQLRTPVSGIRLLTRDLMNSGLRHPDSPPDPEVLAELDAAAGRATHLVQQLLSLARAEAGAGGQRQNVNICYMARDMVDKWRRQAFEYGKTLLFMPPSEELFGMAVEVDPQVLQDALDNLIENALVHGGADCKVSVLQHENEACIEIADDGPALSPNTLERMRQPFWRANEVPRPGTGLGMSIAEKAAIAFGGHLDILSSTQPSGTRVRMYFPMVTVSNS
jgi:two-component system sensor histidine kinase TctE